jgi:hypothetical protein
MKWKEIPWAEWCIWIQGKTVRSTTEDYKASYRELPRGSRATLLEFTDGSKSLVLSNDDPDLSEVTPGAGIQPPSVMIEA